MFNTYIEIWMVELMMMMKNCDYDDDDDYVKNRFLVVFSFLFLSTDHRRLGEGGRPFEYKKEGIVYLNSKKLTRVFRYFGLTAFFIYSPNRNEYQID